MTDFTIRQALPGDALGYAHCHVECLAETYAHLMPPEFACSRREDLPQQAAATRQELVAMARARAEGRLPQRTHWVAEVDGEVVGIASAGPGVPDWEREHHDNPEPPVGWNLDHIYTRASTHGSGLGQALFDVALLDEATGRGRGAWLWILHGNPRAEAFYRRNGFVPDGLEVTCGASWYHRPMFRMWRPDPR